MSLLTKIQALAELMSWRWLLAGTIVLSLMGFSEAFATWSRMDTAQQAQLSPIAYFGAVIVSMNLWLLIAILLRKLSDSKPLVPNMSLHHWGIHLVTSLIACSLHLLLNVLLLWWVFSARFEFGSAYLETMARWLPYSVLAYWACLAMMTIFMRRGIAPVSTNSGPKEATIAVKSQGEIILLKHQAIDWIESMDNYVVMWSGDQRYIHKASMKQIESLLDPEQFKRVHRSTIVNLKRVQKLTSIEQQMYIVLDSGKQLAISRRKKSEIKSILTFRTNR